MACRAKQLTGEPVAGKPHTGFGGRGRLSSFPTPIQRGLSAAIAAAAGFNVRAAADKRYSLATNHRERELIRSLRKGCTSVYIQHVNTGHSIGAEKYECEVKDGNAVVRFSLRPVDGNQSYDEGYLHTDDLISVDINDAQVIDGLRSYLQHHKQEFSAWQLQVLSRGKLFSFSVTPKLLPHGTLQFRVEAKDG